MEDNSRKRKKARRYYNFHTFADPGCPIQPTGAFRDNVRLFLQECADAEDYQVENMQIWRTSLVHETRSVVVPLYTIEEDVKHSARPFCNHCRCAGWSHHFVSKRRYHFIIPADEDWCKSLEEGDFEMQKHLLHGMIHCNGFGHLICINGIEGGSKHLCGKDIMDLWDRICTNLHARKITVEDLSKKHMMELRLLHGIAYGHPWFGRWGYRFCNGNFSARQHTYESALEILSSITLVQIINDFSFDNSWKNVKQIIDYYRNLSETSLVTIRDLFKFMLSLKSRIAFGLLELKSILNVPSNFSLKPCTENSFDDKYVRKDKSGKCRNFTTVAANMGKDGRWSVRRLEYTASVIVDAMKKKRAENRYGNCVMSRQEARDAARLYIGDTGLIDHVLKSMSDVVVGDSIIRKVSNRTTKKLEFYIQEVKNGSQVDQCSSIKPVQTSPPMPGRDVYVDISYLYTNLLFRCPESDVMNLAVRSILDCKYFVKEWLFRDEPNDMLRYICRLIPSSLDFENEHIRNYTPAVYVELPLHATIGELKLAVQRAMRDTYFTMETIEIIEIAHMEEVEDEELLFGSIESGTEISVRGYGLDLNTDFKHEGGVDNWIVRCICGAQDDDGERMVACDICEIWHHTRCIGIDDCQEVPQLFICETCCTSLAPQRSQFLFDFHNSSAFTITPHTSNLLGNMSSSRCWELYQSEDSSGIPVQKMYC